MVSEVEPWSAPNGRYDADRIIYEKHAVINIILSHLGIQEEHAHSPPAEETQTVELTSEPYYDDLPINEIL